MDRFMRWSWSLYSRRAQQQARQRMIRMLHEHNPELSRSWAEQNVDHRLAALGWAMK